LEDARKPNYELAEIDYMSGMKYKDIAEKYSVTINTVKSWKQRYDWNKGKKSVHTKVKKVCTQKKPKDAKKETVPEEVVNVEENPDLTDKQRLFCLYYAKSFNATQSYKKAYECDYKTAQAIAYRLLEKDGVREEIKRLKQGRFNRALLEPEDIFQKFMDIAFADLTDYISCGRETVPVMGPFGPIMVQDKETKKKVPLTKEVNVVKFKESGDMDGTILTEVKQGKDGASIKLADRMKALDWLADHMDLATEEQRVRIAALKEKSNSGDSELVRLWAEKVMKSRQNPDG